MWTIKLNRGIEINNVTFIAIEEEMDILEYSIINGIDVKMKLSDCLIIKDTEGNIMYENKNKPMKKVIRLDEPKEESEKPIELTHYDVGNGWEEDTEGIEEDMIKIVYLGKCKVEGDLFAIYFKAGTITLFKGHLNDGVY